MYRSWSVKAGHAIYTKRSAQFPYEETEFILQTG